MEGYDTFMAQVAEVSLGNGAIRVHKVTVAADMGRHAQREPSGAHFLVRLTVAQSPCR